MSERKLRRMLRKNGYELRKIRGYDRYRVIDARTNCLIFDDLRGWEVEAEAIRLCR